MVRYYDNWEKLVEAVMRKEQLRQLSLADSISTSTRSYDSDFSFSSSISLQKDDGFSGESPSPLCRDAVGVRLGRSAKELGKSSGFSRKTTNAIWTGLSIFRVFASKKDYGREERPHQWNKSQRTFHGVFSKETNYEVSLMEAKKRSEITRLGELHTLKGHIESVMKAKGLDIDSIQNYYTI